MFKLATSNQVGTNQTKHVMFHQLREGMVGIHNLSTGLQELVRVGGCHWYYKEEEEEQEHLSTTVFLYWQKGLFVDLNIDMEVVVWIL